MRRFHVFFAIVTVVAAAAAYFLGIRPRASTAARLERIVTLEDTPPVGVGLAHRAEIGREIVLPADFRALKDTAIRARASGYIAKWLVDIGARVKAGDVLAVIDSPETDQQLNQARAALEQAKTAAELARTSAERWKELLGHNAVSRQEVDQRVADAAARVADLKAAQAEVDRLEQLKKFETVTAPFDGVVTARNVEVGTLTAPAGDPELFHLAQSGTIRVYVSVPQTDVRVIHPGMKVEVLLSQYPGRVFEGAITRHSGALDRRTRTLLTEIQVPNPKGELLPGMFSKVRLRFASKGPALLIPANALMVRPDGAKVAMIGEGDRVELKKVVLGRDFGDEIEIVSGIAEGARLIMNPRDDLEEGARVHPSPAAPNG